MYNYDLTDKCFFLNFLFACVFIFYLFIFLYFFSGFKKCNTEYPYSVYFEFLRAFLILFGKKSVHISSI